MSKHPPARPYRLYPAYCFPSSPTFDAWVKLTAADVQKLRREPGFHGQSLYFYLNHPIRFVRTVGVIVAIDDINTKYTVLTIDDGSGAVLELKIVRIVPAELNAVDTSSNTTISNLDIISRPGTFDVIIDGQTIEIGTIVKAKGTVSEFRSIKQLDLKRIQVIASTNEEAKAWAETAEYKKKYLSVPWRLTVADHTRIKNKIRFIEEQENEYRKRKADHEAKRAERYRARATYLAERDVRLESRRRKEEIMMNSGSLL